MRCPKCHSDNPETAAFCSDCGTNLTSPKEIRVTETLETPKEELTTGSTFAGRYQIIEELGKGGMGNVYKVLDKEVNAKIALKLIKPEIAADKKTIERFRNELKTARDISHKNICRMYDLNKEGDSYYITMEYVEGQDLKSLIRQTGQLALPTTFSIAKQVCEGLSEAHKLGTVHRDLKPSNIMVDKEGKTRIMDFGIARSLKAKGITGTGVMIGTPEYMSPEQVDGKEVDQRSDIYSLGVILFEMLTGRVPFGGDTSLSIAVKHKSKSPPDPENINPQIPKNLSHIILKCMKKDKAHRYQKIEELYSDLMGVEEELSTTRRVPAEEEVKTSPAAQERWKNSIAVLPFTNMSADPEQEYFCDGLAEELINALTQIKDLRVVARTSAFSFKGKDVDVEEIGKKLKVDNILEGSVRKAGNRLRITAQLVNVADGFHLWSERYDRDMADIFAIQDEISLAIVDKLKIRLVKAEKEAIVKRPTRDIESYNLYLMGSFFLKKRTPEGLQKGIQYFQNVVEKDPGYALAYAGIADYYNVMGYLDFLASKDSFPKAKEAAEKALEIDDSLAAAHTSLAWALELYDWDWEGTERELKRALELNPNHVPAQLWYSGLLTVLGRNEEARDRIKWIKEHDPVSFLACIYASVVYHCARQHDMAIEELHKAIELNPASYVSHWYLVSAYVQKAMYSEAVMEAQKALDLTGGQLPVLKAVLGYAYAMAGRRDEAENILNEVVKISEQRHIPHTWIAMIFGGLDRMDEAFEWLERGYEEHDHWLFSLKALPMYDIFRPDPRFQALLKKMNLE